MLSENAVKVHTGRLLQWPRGNHVYVQESALFKRSVKLCVYLVLEFHLVYSIKVPNLKIIHNYREIFMKLFSLKRVSFIL